jgi:hypothetical protein
MAKFEVGDRVRRKDYENGVFIVEAFEVCYAPAYIEIIKVWLDGSQEALGKKYNRTWFNAAEWEKAGPKMETYTLFLTVRSTMGLQDVVDILGDGIIPDDWDIVSVVGE